MQQHFNIDLDELRTHAASVDRLMDRMRKATETCDPGCPHDRGLRRLLGFLARVRPQAGGRSPGRARQGRPTR